MTTLKELIEGDGEDRIDLDGMAVVRYRNGVINIRDVNGELVQIARERLDQFRAALKEAGYWEAESWIPGQGASWLSDGVYAGVSMRVRKI